MSNRLTIKDIAKLLNVHHSTVSRALRNDSRVKKETRELIIDYAKKCGYQVNMSALQFRGTVKNMIAIIVPSIYHRFFSNIISIITDMANKNGFIVSVFQSNESFTLEKKIIESIIQHNVAGVIASVSMETLSNKHFLELKKFNIPLVFFDRVCEDIEVSKITINNKEIISKAVNLLVEKGYQRIAYITGTDKLSIFRHRQMGYRESIEKHNLRFNQIYESSKYFNIDDGFKAIDEIFSDSFTPDAIICDSHSITLGVILKLKEKGIAIPKDVGLIGHGANIDNLVITPKLTAIIQPEREIAEKAYEALFNNIESNGQLFNESTIIPAKIISRDSC